MSDHMWTGDPAPTTPVAPPRSGVPQVTTALVHQNGRVAQKTTTTRHFDACGNMVREEVVVEEYALAVPLPGPLPYPYGPHWWQQWGGNRQQSGPQILTN